MLEPLKTKKRRKVKGLRSFMPIVIWLGIPAVTFPVKETSKTQWLFAEPVIAQAASQTKKMEDNNQKSSKEDLSDSNKPSPAPETSKTAETPEKVETIETDSKIAIESGNNELMSINFLDVDIRKALSALAMERDVNIATSKDVSGKVSVHLHHATLEQTLKAITMADGFTYLKDGDLYYIYKPKEALDPYAERLEVRIFKIKFADIDKLDEVMGALSGIRPVKIHKDKKIVMVEDIPENIKKIEKIIHYWDSLPRQVIIEAKILEIGLTDDMSLGVNRRDILGDVTIETGGFTRTALPTANPDPSVSIATGTGIFANLITNARAEQQLVAALDALKTKTSVNALSTPKILAIHGKPARVQVGGKQGYRVTTVSEGISTETVEFIDTGTILEITPYLDNENYVLLEVKPTISSVELSPDGIPNVTSREVSTWLLAKDGDTVFIGGLIQDTKTRTRSMIPCLGGIPGLGVVFGRTTKAFRKTELVILITPRVLDVERKRVDQEAIEKTKKMEEKLKKEPLPQYKELYEFLFKTD